MEQTTEQKELEAIILDYMQGHNTVSLATEKDGAPHAATVFFVNIGFELYFLSSPSSRHGENFSRNPRVSATINEDYSNWLLIKGIQLEGRVESIGGILENGRIARVYVKKFPAVADFLLSPKKLGEAIAQKVAKVRFHKLTPTRMYFLNNELGFGHREELILP
ncbi:MAG: pyridoxamine 5'-phosphate oxidase family protein [Thermodesulfobacteriota bacterium]|nr:pyridoxamine 5'-phosphate oxidase family protein [Thermodesulfobacteriota bacterium]